jgi:hypothetical protein
MDTQWPWGYRAVESLHAGDIVRHFLWGPRNCGVGHDNSYDYMVYDAYNYIVNRLHKRTFNYWYPGVNENIDGLTVS